MKTNKSYTKRIKVTARGKLLRRKAGQNHFNARNDGAQGRKKHGTTSVALADYARIRKYVR
ncbi:MAG: 50S ribosomal protein L35 [Patescibacteria group bacterium]